MTYLVTLSAYGKLRMGNFKCKW